MSNDLHVIVSHETHVNVWQTVHLQTNQITVPQSLLVVTCAGMHSFYNAVLIFKKKNKKLTCKLQCTDFTVQNKP